MVLAAYWMAPTRAILAKTWTCGVDNWFDLTSAITDFGTQRVSHYMLGSQLRSMTEWWISNTQCSKQASDVLIYCDG